MRKEFSNYETKNLSKTNNSYYGRQRAALELMKRRAEWRRKKEPEAEVNRQKQKPP